MPLDYDDASDEADVRNVFEQATFMVRVFAVVGSRILSVEFLGEDVGDLLVRSGIYAEDHYGSSSHMCIYYT